MIWSKQRMYPDQKYYSGSNASAISLTLAKLNSLPILYVVIYLCVRSTPILPSHLLLYLGRLIYHGGSGETSESPGKLVKMQIAGPYFQTFWVKEVWDAT